MKAATEANTTDEVKSTDDLDTDTIHQLLSNSRRRAVISILNERGVLDKGELSTLVAADEYDKQPEELGSQERKRVQVSLLQQHFDKLEDANVIERDNNQVSLTENADELVWHLEAKPPENVFECVKTALKDLF